MEKNNAKNVEHKRQKRIKTQFCHKELQKQKFFEQNVFFGKQQIFLTKKIIFWIFAQIQPLIDLQVFI